MKWSVNLKVDVAEHGAILSLMEYSWEKFGVEESRLNWGVRLHIKSCVLMYSNNGLRVVYLVIMLSVSCNSVID